jgi:AcrR family transcriptional regulator
MITTPVKRSRGRPKKTEEQRDDGNRRQALIFAAGYLFRTQGFDATSTREIAKRVGMQAGSPFYHFQNKQDLLLAVIEEGMKQAITSQQLALILAKEEFPEIDAKGLLVVLIRHHLNILLGPGSDFIPVMLYEERSLSGSNRLLVNHLKDEYESIWIPVLEKLYNQRQLAAPVKVTRLLLLGALNWTVQWFDTYSHDSLANAEKFLSLDELVEAAVKLFIKHD